ncbi:hypothetical protein Salat_0657000 [Sesamum alatum]|uniref:Uncharacterized protein n=1 Tax=Sesamum alatum TaxID=300844 RepID=A0AAE1YQU1_9LAMI|nr:hypothetical protein Salat_0657000 [Sesamum alatum]
MRKPTHLSNLSVRSLGAGPWFQFWKGHFHRRFGKTGKKKCFGMTIFHTLLIDATALMTLQKPELLHDVASLVPSVSEPNLIRERRGRNGGKVFVYYEIASHLAVLTTSRLSKFCSKTLSENLYREGFSTAQQFFHTNLAAQRCYCHNNR